MEMKFCQSCGMPLSDATVLGTETNGSKNEEYAEQMLTVASAQIIALTAISKVNSHKTAPWMK